MSTTTSRGTRGPYAKSAARRDRIASAVLELVLEKGHRNLTTAEVAERAATNEATVLYHFPTKEHLLVAGLARSSPGAIVVDTELDLEDEVARMVGEVTADANTNGMRLFVGLQGEASSPEHPAHDFFQEHYREGIQTLGQALRKRQTLGLTDPDLDPDRLARMVMAVWDGLQSQWLIDPTFDLAAEIIAAFRLLTRQDTMKAREVVQQLESLI